MKTRAAFRVIAFIGSLSFPVHAAEDGGSMPYDSFNKVMRLFESKKIDGATCVPLFLKSNQAGVEIDPTKAKFRVNTSAGDDVILKVDKFSDVPAAELSEFERDLIKKGFTHRVWIPTNDKRFLGGSIMHSLPKGSVDFEQSRKLKISLGGEAQEETDTKQNKP